MTIDKRAYENARRVHDIRETRLGEVIDGAWPEGDEERIVALVVSLLRADDVAGAPAPLVSRIMASVQGAPPPRRHRRLKRGMRRLLLMGRRREAVARRLRTRTGSRRA